MFHKGEIINIDGHDVRVIGRHRGHNVRLYIRDGELRVSMGWLIGDEFVRQSLRDLIPRLLKRYAAAPPPTEKVRDKESLRQMESELMSWLPERYAYWCEKMNVHGVPMSIKPYRSCWGKYMVKGPRIVFSTYLATKPRDFAEGTIVHELAHHFVKNHSKDFYRIVLSYMPDYWESHRRSRKNH